MSLKYAQDAVNTLAKALRVKPIVLLPDQIKALTLEDHEEFFFKYDDRLDRLYLSAKILPTIPHSEAKKIAIYELILQAQLEFGEFQIGKIGLDKAKQSILLTERIPADEENSKILVEIFPVFAQTVSAWQDLLKLTKDRD